MAARSHHDCPYKFVIAGMITWGVVVYVLALLSRLLWSIDPVTPVAFTWAVTTPILIIGVGIPSVIALIALVWDWANQ